MNKALIGLALVILVLAGGFFIYSQSAKDPSPPAATPSIKNNTSPVVPNAGTDSFVNPKKSAHFESNTPEHGAILAGAPVNVVINFNFDLAKPSSISVINEGKEYAVEDTVIDPNKLAMRRKLDPNSPDGLYTVNYKACWADGSCHDGNFQFVIDRKLTQEFVDMTGKKKVTVGLKEIAFSPKNIKISKGTEVTWVNQDSVEHTVNTDSHPAHTYYLSQNSRTLKKGDAYSVTFTETGIYPYHCTPHAASMKGAVLVE